MKNSIFSIKRIVNKKIALFIPVLISTFFLTTQNYAQDIVFYKVNSDVTMIPEIVNNNTIDLVNLESLVKDLNTSIYLTNGISRLNGTGSPVIVDTDVQSINELYQKNSAYNQVELIKITINSASDINSLVDLDKFVSFYRLKFIYVDFTFDVCGNQIDACLESKIKNFIKGIDFNVIVLYKLSIPN